MSTYTMSNIIATPEQHDMFGTKYIVKFAEDANTYELWFKKPPVEGQQLEGEVVGGKFKKTKTWQGGQTSGQTSAPKKFDQKANNDGQRQGMCINNASQFVLAKADKPMSPVEWADAVFRYATALYSKGDLKVVETAPEAPQEMTKQDVLDIFES